MEEECEAGIRMGRGGLLPFDKGSLPTTHNR
jgi:hypothetical protein